jgi:hypothetical protein
MFILTCKYEQLKWYLLLETNHYFFYYYFFSLSTFFSDYWVSWFSLLVISSRILALLSQAFSNSILKPSKSASEVNFAQSFSVYGLSSLTS